MAVAFAIIVPGSIGDYSALVEKVALWLDRDDLQQRAPDFIALAEARWNRLLRTPEMEMGRVTLEAGEKVTLPVDFLQARSIYLEGAPDRPLRAMSPNALAVGYSGRPGIPAAYAIAGRELRLAPPPRESVMVSLDYYQRIPSLSVNTPSNWLLESHPDIYLYGALIQAEAYINNDERIGLWKQAHDEALSELMAAGRKARWGGGPLVPNVARQVGRVAC